MKNPFIINAYEQKVCVNYKENPLKNVGLRDEKFLDYCKNILKHSELCGIIRVKY